MSHGQGNLVMATHALVYGFHGMWWAFVGVTLVWVALLFHAYLYEKGW